MKENPLNMETPYKGKSLIHRIPYEREFLVKGFFIKGIPYRWKSLVKENPA